MECINSDGRSDLITLNVNYQNTQTKIKLQTKFRPYHLLVVYIYNPSAAAHIEQQHIYLTDSCGGPVHER